MKVKYKKDKTIITLEKKEERKVIFEVLRSYEIKDNHKEKYKIVGELLDEWMEAAGTLR